MSKCLDTYYLNLTYYLHLLPLNEQIIEIKKLHRYIEKYPQIRDTFIPINTQFSKNVNISRTILQKN